MHIMGCACHATLYTVFYTTGSILLLLCEHVRWCSHYIHSSEMPGLMLLRKKTTHTGDKPLLGAHIIGCTHINAQSAVSTSHSRTYSHTHTHTHAHTHTHTRTHSLTHTHTHSHTYSHTHLLTHSITLPRPLTHLCIPVTLSSTTPFRYLAVPEYFFNIKWVASPPSSRIWSERIDNSK